MIYYFIIILLLFIILFYYYFIDLVTVFRIDSGAQSERDRVDQTFHPEAEEEVRRAGQLQPFHLHDPGHFIKRRPLCGSFVTGRWPDLP